MKYLEHYCKIIDSTTLADQSKHQYKARLKRLTDITGHDIDWVIDNCKETFEALKAKNIVEAQTVKAFINSILTLFKYVEGLKKKKTSQHKCWLKLFYKVKAIADHKYETLQASEKQINSYVSWAKIIEEREKLDKTTDDYLLLSLYTMIPPCRADLNKIQIFKNRDDIKDEGNYLIIDRKNMKLIYNEFKSKSKKLQKYEKVLPENLTEVIADSLRRKPREYLIISPKTKLPYDKPHSYNVYFNKVLNRIFKKNVTINTLRHSFVNAIDFNKMTPLDKKQLSKDLMHSEDMMDRYRLFVPNLDGKEKVCEVVCKDA